MPKVPHNVNQENGFRPFNARNDQPCSMLSCASNRGGGCVKMFCAGQHPTGFGTSKCPGYLRVPPTPKKENIKTRRKIVTIGQQSRFSRW